MDLFVHAFHEIFGFLEFSKLVKIYINLHVVHFFLQIYFFSHQVTKICFPSWTFLNFFTCIIYNSTVPFRIQSLWKQNCHFRVEITKQKFHFLSQKENTLYTLHSPSFSSCIIIRYSLEPKCLYTAPCTHVSKDCK